MRWPQSEARDVAGTMSPVMQCHSMHISTASWPMPVARPHTVTGPGQPPRSANRDPFSPSSCPHRLFRAFQQGFAAQQQREPRVLLARLAYDRASQSQLGSFVATKFIPEDPSSVQSVPTTGRCFTPTPVFPSPVHPPPPPGQDIPTWSRVPRAGWERPRSHGTVAWPDPLRMLQRGRPRPPTAREEPTGFSLAPQEDLAAPTASQTHAPQQQQLLSPAGPGAAGHVPAGREAVWQVCALLTPRMFSGDCRGGGSRWGGTEMGRGEGKDGEQAAGRSSISARQCMPARAEP